MRKIKSFTLVELLVVISIIAVLAAVAIPTVTGVIHRARDAATIGDMRTIQTSAVTMRLEGRSLVGVNCEVGTDPALTAICRSINDNSPGSTLSFSGARNFCIQVPLHNGRFWRVDQTGFAGEDICGYVGRWNMNENPAIHNTQIRDTTGVNHGTLSTNPAPPATPDTANKAIAGALSFDGADDFVSVPHSGSLNNVFGTSTTFALEVWAFPRAWVNWAAIMNKARGGCWGHTTNGMWASDQGGFACAMGSGTEPALCNPAGSIIHLFHRPSLNSWNHIVCTADGTNLIMFVNGTEVSRTAIAGLTHARSTNTEPLVFGKRCAGCGPFFNGIVDEARAYNRGLSVGEILTSFRRDCRRLRPDLCP